MKDQSGSKKPRSAARVAADRRDAAKPGLDCKVIEDPELRAIRTSKWNLELNPLGLAAGNFLVERAVSLSMRLERSDLIHDANAANLARDARRVCAERRVREVESMTRVMMTDPDVAHRRLRESTEGCDYLIGEWAQLRTRLDPPCWDMEDEGRASLLLGRILAFRLISRRELRVPTLQIIEHREVAQRLKSNEAGTVGGTRPYRNLAENQVDLNRIDELGEAKRNAVKFILNVIYREVESLVTLRKELLAREALDDTEATFRSWFDASDAGKRLHRSEMETERDLHSAIKELRELNRIASK